MEKKASKFRSFSGQVIIGVMGSPMPGRNLKPEQLKKASETIKKTLNKTAKRNIFG